MRTKTLCRKIMDKPPDEPSAMLIAAQQQLEQRRRIYRQQTGKRSGYGESLTPHIPVSETAVATGQALLAARRRQEAAAQSNPSDTLQTYLPPCPPSPWTIPPATIAPEPTAVQEGVHRLKAYPTVLLGMLERGLEAVGRVWLLLQYLDEQGSGCIMVGEARQQLTSQSSELRICSWRNLRGLLHRGEGIFWQRDGVGRIWLKGTGKVAALLGIGRLQGRPVELPLKALLGGVGGVRAHFYASFHSGRKNSNPISRAKLVEVTHVPTRTQRTYERKTGVTSRTNLAVGEAYTTERVQERAWQHGRATFEFVDYRGQQGRLNSAYIAWWLPNSYTGCHAQRPKGRQRKINRQIDLVTSGAQGNGRPVRRLFYRNGAAAGITYNRDASQDAFWEAGVGVQVRFELWRVIPGKKK